MDASGYAFCRPSDSRTRLAAGASRRKGALVHLRGGQHRRACGSTLLAQGGRRPTLEGVWKVTEIVVTGAGSYSVSTPEPSLFLFAKTHYSLMWVPGDKRRTFYVAEVPTNEEKLAAFDSLTASAGRYEVSGTTVTFRPIVGKSPTFTSGAFITEQFRIEGNTMTLSWRSSDAHLRIGQQVVPSTRPVSETRMKLVRVE